MRTFLSFLCAGATTFLIADPSLHADDKVVVHEWGTFTSLQDESGNAIGGINVDDEPVPYFVSSVAIGVAPQYGSERMSGSNFGLPPYAQGKGWISGDPRVTMRLETPVLYIYPPKGQKPKSVPPLNVHVDFHGGVLSQFYPHADFSGLPLINYPGNPEMSGRFPYIDKTAGLTAKTTTSLDWKGVRLGSTEKPIETEAKVWTTPREVSAPVLEVKFSDKDNQGTHAYTQAEHFLFYRGVGHLDSPLYLNQDPYNVGEKDKLYLWSSLIKYRPSQPQYVLQAALIANDALYDQAWLTDMRADGTCAFRSISEFGGLRAQGRMAPVASMNFKFESVDFNSNNLDKLKASMHDALVKEGLYPDEATAMLKTWELSYFKSPGLRFFYIVPRAWVDKTLPLKVAGAPTKITRVMVGRIELITDTQKAVLARLATGPCPDLAAIKSAAIKALQSGKFSKEEIAAVSSGEKPLSSLSIGVPPLVQDYLSLGRFRDALIVHEQQLHPSPVLAQFIKDNQLVPQEN